MGKRFDSFLGKGNNKLDSIMGRSFKPVKFRATMNMAISRLAVLKNQRQSRCSIARADVVEFLNAGNHDRALLRVDQVIKEQNMLDVFNLFEGYSHLLIERVHLVEQEKVCPEELKEAISSLIYGATRCGEFPELQEIRQIFTSRYGKDFVNRAIELRNNCSVNLKIVQKLSTSLPSLEMKMKVLKEIASDNHIVLQIEETVPTTSLENLDQYNGTPSRTQDLLDSSTRRRKYKDVADAAQVAFEAAAYAAEAARAAVELSRSESTDNPDDRSTGSGTVRRMKSQLETHVNNEILETHVDYGEKSEQGYVSDENGKKYRTSISSSSSSSTDDNRNKTIRFDEYESEEEKRRKLEAHNMSRMGSGNGLKLESGLGNLTGNPNMEPLNLNRNPISVRSRWTGR